MMLSTRVKGAGMKKLLLVVSLVVIAACSNNGSTSQGTDQREAAVPRLQLEDTDLTAANMTSAALVHSAALTGAEVGCAALAQMVALAQAAAQTGEVAHHASWLAGWKTVRDL